jgi:hypothetical protein
MATTYSKTLVSVWDTDSEPRRANGGGEQCKKNIPDQLTCMVVSVFVSMLLRAIPTLASAVISTVPAVKATLAWAWISVFLALLRIFMLTSALNSPPNTEGLAGYASFLPVCWHTTNEKHTFNESRDIRVTIDFSEVLGVH